jgi:colanic acid biosynthesis protein WcaH
LLAAKTFKTVIENTPLVSIDLCLVCDSQVLLGKRTNEPLKGEWFTPGGRIHKNETWQDALLRIAEAELGLSGVMVEDFSLMGVWDHFYDNSVADKKVSTHYVNLPYYIDLKDKPFIQQDEQHHEMSWFDLVDVASQTNKFHKYMNIYANWLLKKGLKND